ncbi:MAG: hypothetical protein QMC95_02580 [Desulfitobacteriaceae bacterium]|nr:hypothetical protein [Desulfitobacteriaceae bacterium]
MAAAISLGNHMVSSMVLYEPGDLAGILQALRQLENKGMRERLGNRGYARVQREFSAKRMGKAYEKVYRELVRIIGL